MYMIRMPDFETNDKSKDNSILKKATKEKLTSFELSDFDDLEHEKPKKINKSKKQLK